MDDTAPHESPVPDAAAAAMDPVWEKWVAGLMGLNIQVLAPRYVPTTTHGSFLDPSLPKRLDFSHSEVETLLTYREDGGNASKRKVAQLLKEKQSVFHPARTVQALVTWNTNRTAHEKANRIPPKGRTKFPTVALYAFWVSLYTSFISAVRKHLQAYVSDPEKNGGTPEVPLGDVLELDTAFLGSSIALVVSRSGPWAVAVESVDNDDDGTAGVEGLTALLSSKEHLRWRGRHVPDGDLASAYSFGTSLYDTLESDACVDRDDVRGAVLTETARAVGSWFALCKNDAGEYVIYTAPEHPNYRSFAPPRVDAATTASRVALAASRRKRAGAGDKRRRDGDGIASAASAAASTGDGDGDGEDLFDDLTAEDATRDLVTASQTFAASLYHSDAGLQAVASAVFGSDEFRSLVEQKVADAKRQRS
jgi:hypothetical protein